MSSYSSSGMSSYDPASTSSSDHHSSPSTSPSTSPTFPLFIRTGASTPPPRSHSPTKAACPTSPTLPPPTTPHRPRAGAPARDACPHTDGLGVDPSTLVGRTLTRVRRSRTHPCTTLHFADGAAFRLLVAGYDPAFARATVPKALESDSCVLNPRAPSGVADVCLTVTHAAAITLSDRAFQARDRDGEEKDGKDKGKGEDKWTQRHAAVAMKFEEEPGWHCVWAAMAEYDAHDAERCVFRNYADVYLDKLPPHAPPTPSRRSRESAREQGDTPPVTPRKQKHKPKHPGNGNGHGHSNGQKGKPAQSPERTLKARW